MGCTLQTADVSTDDLGLASGWYLDIYSAPINTPDYAVDATETGMQQAFCGPDEKARQETLCTSSESLLLLMLLPPVSPTRPSCLHDPSI
jgi:hypothetical protein